MPEITPTRNFRLYGRHRIPRSHRRVMLVLLTGAGRLSGYPICRAAMTGPGTVYPVLERMEKRGWVVGEWEERSDGHPRRRFYRLTPAGRNNILELLGLEEESGG